MYYKEVALGVYALYARMDNGDVVYLGVFSLNDNLQACINGVPESWKKRA